MTAETAWSMTMFRAMGSPCRIVAPTHELAVLGQERVHELEALWTRFQPASEISRLNATAGQLALVSACTYELIELAELARQATDGLFNPLMLEQLVELGYDRTWEHVRRVGTRLPDPVPGSTEPIELYPDMRAVRLPPGTRFDPGGIGKGLAADMVVAVLREAGAHSVQVELGGDLRVVGPGWAEGGWTVHIDDSDHDADDAGTIALPQGGGVATSSVMRRRWRRGDIDVHHLVDPFTGAPALTDLDAVTVAAPTLWWAEVVAKVAVIAGAAAARELLREHGMTGVLVHAGTPARYEVVASEEVAA